MGKVVERFCAKGSKAKQAQTRGKAGGEKQGIQHGPTETAGLGVNVREVERTGRVIFELEDGYLAYGEKVLVDDAELWLERGEHVSLVGPNGTGKTTLIEALAGQRPLDDGRLRMGHNVQVGYLSQHGEEI